MKASLKVMLFIVVLALMAADVSADLSRSDKKAIKNMVDGKLYLRVEAPCIDGRHAFGAFTAPVVEVSRDNDPIHELTKVIATFSSSGWHSHTVRWQLLPNDAVEVTEVDFGDEGEIECELGGLGSNHDVDSSIKFINIQSLDDFEAAFEKVFAKGPVQNEHEDWSSEIKQAIQKRHLEIGMTTEQAFLVVGVPERYSKTVQEGVTTEVWHLRLNRGVDFGTWFTTVEKKEDIPEALIFVDGKLTEMLVDTGLTAADLN